jgi:hypothetical protein
MHVAGNPRALLGARARGAHIQTRLFWPCLEWAADGSSRRNKLEALARGLKATMGKWPVQSRGKNRDDRNQEESRKEDIHAGSRRKQSGRTHWCTRAPPAYARGCRRAALPCNSFVIRVWRRRGRRSCLWNPQLVCLAGASSSPIFRVCGHSRLCANEHTGAACTAGAHNGPMRMGPHPCLAAAAAALLWRSGVDACPQGLPLRQTRHRD